MVANPFQDGLSVKVSSDTSDFNDGIAAATQKLGSMRKAVGVLGGALAALSAGGLAVATKAAADFESEMVELEKTTSSDFASEFEDTVLQLSKELPATANELANLAAAAGRFGVAEENIESFTRTVTKLSEATDLAVEEAGEAMAKLSTLTDTPIDKLENLGSTLNALANTAATSTSELVSNMLESSSALSSLGASNTEIAALAATMNETFSSASKAGRALRRVAQEMLDPRKVESLAQALGMSAEEFKRMREESPVKVIRMMAERMGEGGEAANTLRENLSTFSRQALGNLSNNLDGLNANLKTSKQAFEENTSLQEEYEAAMATTNKQLKQLKSSLLAVAIETGQNFLPHVKSAIQGLRGLVEHFSKLNSATNGMLGVLVGLGGVIAGLTAAVVAFLPQIASIATILSGSVIPALGTTAGALTALTGPVGLAIAAVGLLAAAFATDFAGIATTTNQVVGALSTQLSKTANLLRSLLAPAFSQAAGDLRTFASTAESALRPVLQIIGTRLVGAIQTAGAQIRAFIQQSVALYNSLSPTQKALIGTTAAVAGAAAAIMGLLNPITAAIAAVVGLKAAWDQNLFGIRDTTRQVLSEIQETIIRPILQSLQALWATHGDAIVRETRENFEALRGYIQTVMNALAPIVSAALQAIRVAIDTYVALYQAIWERWGDEIITISRWVFDAIISVLGTALDAMITTYRVFSNVFQGDWEAAWNAAAGFFERVFTGILAFAKKWGGGFLEWLRGLFRDASDWLRSTAKSLLEGAARSITVAVQGVFQAFADWLFGNSLIKDLFRNIASWMRSSAKNAVGGAARQVVGAMEGAFNSIDVSGILGAIGSIISKAGRAIGKVNRIPDVPDIPNPFGGGSGGGGGGGGGGGSSAGGGGGGMFMQNAGGIGMASGGFVKSNGLAMLHAGEFVLSESDVDRNAESPGGKTVNINVDQINASGRQEGKEAADALYREFASKL